MKTPAKENVAASAIPAAFSSPTPSLLKQPTTARTPRTVTPSKPSGYTTPTRSKLATTPQPDLNDKGTFVLTSVTSTNTPLQNACAHLCGCARPNHRRQPGPLMCTKIDAQSHFTRGMS